MATDNRTLLNAGDAVTGWVSDGAGPSVNTDVGQRYQGTGAIQGQHTNTDEAIYTTAIGGTRNLADATVYFLLKDNLVQTYVNGGVQALLFDGTNRIGYDIAGNDSPGLDLEPYYRGFKFDVSEVVTAPGTNFTTYAGSEAALTQTAITGVGIGTVHLSKAVGNVANIFIDAMRFVLNGNYALTINGGTSATPINMTNVQTEDSTNGWGMIGNPLGAVYNFFAPTEWGNSTATGDVYFTATNEQWFWIGDNGGGRSVGSTHFPMRIVGNSTDTIDIKWDNLVIVNTGTRSQFIAGDINVNVLQFNNVTFTDLDTIVFTTQSTGNRFVNNCTFNNCGQVYMNTIDADNCVFNGSTNANGALLWDQNSDETNQTNLTFNSDGTGHAIYINPVGDGPGIGGSFEFSIDGYSVNGYESANNGSTGNTVFLVNNNNNNDITINVTNGTGNFSYERQSGYTGTVTIVNSVTLTVNGIRTDSEIRILNLDNTTRFNYELAGSEQIQGQVQEVSIINGGTGYSVNDTLTIVGGSGTAATLNVVSVDGGVITSVNIISPGSYTLDPQEPAAVTGGTGTGATFNLDISGSFTYTYDASLGVRVAIVVFNLNFRDVRIEQLLPSQSSSLLIQQTGDRVYI